MADRDELELRLATTLAPMLLTIAIFSLTIMGLTPDPGKSIVDELFGFLGATCLLSAALVTDSALDKNSLTLFDRLKFLGGGYLAFAFVVGAMSAGIPILYAAKRAGDVGLSWDKSFILFFGTGLSVMIKLLTFQDKQVFTAAMLVFYVLSVYVLWK